MTVHPSLSYNPNNARPVSLTRCWFGPKSPVRSPLLREYCYFLGLLRCFSSPGSLRIMRSPACRRGCPIRRWWDQGLHAAPPPLSQRCHVLRRHPAPRHPPSAHHVFPDQARGRVEHARPGRFTRPGSRVRARFLSQSQFCKLVRYKPKWSNTKCSTISAAFTAESW